MLEKTVGKTSPEKGGEAGPDKFRFCRHCHTNFDTPAELRAHAVRAKVFCEFCKTTLSDTKEHEMHMLEEHPMDDTCQFCGAYIPDVEGLAYHIRKHTTMGPIHYRCFGCMKMFKSSKEKEKHPCVAYACPKCNEPQTGPEGLDEHLKEAHKSSEPKTVPLKRGKGRPRHFPVGGEASAPIDEPDEPAR